MDLFGRPGEGKVRYTHLDGSVRVTTCRSCKAEIQWSKLNGKPHPVDVIPTTDGNIDFISEDLCRRVQPGSSPRLFLSHFATCPQSKEWRKK